ncbi:MAG: AmmeMemoRadiSam system protein B [Chloroflexi bacterium]|nr:AmmeMemoRadiSam system protein B [Chloroflexota bacterium]
MSMTVRPSPLAGTWYPADPKVLAMWIDRLLLEARKDLPPIDPARVIALIAPHAGLRYSGPVAARAYAVVAGRSYERVAVVGPMHHLVNAPLLTTAYDAWETPLGLVPVDHATLRQLDEALRARGLPGLRRLLNDPEHSLEMEVIFLQRALQGTFHLLPLMLATVDPTILQGLGEALAEHIAPGADLMVASSDLSHYYPQKLANALDAEMLRRILSLDPMAVLRAEEEGKGFACGRAAIATILWASLALGATEAVLLGYATSGDITGDYRQVVGYPAVAILR